MFADLPAWSFIAPIQDVPWLGRFTDLLWTRDEADFDLTEQILSPYDLLGLPLIEWGFDSRNELWPIFQTVSKEGLQHVWIVDHPYLEKRDPLAIRVPLSEEGAQWLADLMFSRPVAMVDEQSQIVLLNWHSDEAHLCMKPGMFTRYLTVNPTDFSLDGSGPVCSSFDGALAESFRRLDAWREWRRDECPLLETWDRLRRQRAD